MSLGQDNNTTRIKSVSIESAHTPFFKISPRNPRPQADRSFLNAPFLQRQSVILTCPLNRQIVILICPSNIETVQNGQVKEGVVVEGKRHERSTCPLKETSTVGLSPFLP
jgi:hypothetical protein